ncbi:MAG: nucleoside-diphosphate kinase [Dehalococcoidia bacterium]|nr:nucleoside-diphosphate kinase [Dehalococcoidia bacterium]
MAAQSRTLILLKPDAVQRGLIGTIISLIEQRGLKIVGLKLIQIDDALARRHYAAHVDKPFFPGLHKFITSSPVVALAVQGVNAVEVMRQIAGATDPSKAAPGTIRANFGLSIGMNIIHGSDSAESAAQELALYFRPNEIIDWQRDADAWIIET